MSSIKLRTFNASELMHIHQPEALLVHLGGPSEVVLAGLDTTRTRIIVTLLHANEPSGLRAVFKYLKAGIQPQTNTVFIIASVNTALTHPTFYYRMLPGQPDLNRCFTSPPDGVQGALATSIKNHIAAYQPELVVDMHNTSGDGPAFCVSVKDSTQHRNLVSHFTQRMVVTDIVLGALMEQDFGCPVITFEAGGDNNNADVIAYEGIHSLLNSEQVAEPVRELEVLKFPRRLELRDGIEVDYALEKNTGSKITLRSDIEKFNFGITPKGTVLGWVDEPLSTVLKLDNHSHLLSEYFSIQDDQLITLHPLRLFMVTTRADIASSDCLFYFQY